MVEEILLKIKEKLHNDTTKEELNNLFDDYHPHDIALAFNQLSEVERQELYELVDEDKIADILEYVDEEQASDYIQEMSFTQGADVLAEMSPDDAADVLQELKEDVDTKDYLKKLEADDRDNLTYLTKHEEDTAGAIMSTDFIKIKSGTDVKDATKVLGYEAHEKEVIDPVFVVNEQDELIGVVALQDLIVARTPLVIDEIMDKSFVFANVSDDVTEVADKITNYDTYALPILDNNKMVGIVTMDDALDVKTEEINEDYGKLAAVSTDTLEDTSILKSILARLPWLVVLLILSLLISNITEVFEEAIKKVTVLWFFNTMILDMAGNAGTQSLAVTVRKISRNELKTFKDTFKHIGKEFLVSFINAVCLGVLCFGVSYLFIKVFKFDTDINAIVTAFVIALSLTTTLCITGVFGAIIPMFMHKVHIDPALASGPLISTLNDILALVIYFGLALLFMSKMVL